MNAVAKTPIFLGYDPGTQNQSATVFTFICADCGRTEHRPNNMAPEGWDIVPEDCSGLIGGFIRCPDCNEAIEQAKFAELQGRVCDYHELGTQLRAGIDLSQNDDMCVIGIHPPKPGLSSGTRPFAIYLERHEAKYLVAMTPEAALMRLSPLGFFISAEGARTTAWELLKYADLAEAPGTLPQNGESQ